VARAKVNKSEPKKAADRIAETARQLFYQQGIRAVGVDEIVTRAGVAKPSLYRSFASKDDLAAAYLRQYGKEFWGWFEETTAPFKGDPRAQFRAWFERMERRQGHASFRGCGITNAAVEYPEAGHPAREAAQENKRQVRTRFRAMAREMGARQPEALGDALMLLMEGAYATSQLFGKGGPAVHVAAAADALIAAHLPPKR
jgi:AcrR family transcriptional regulator